MTPPAASPDGPFYHGTKADLRPGALITPGHRSNYGHGQRTSGWVYLSAILPTWAAALAQGDGPGRIYAVEPTGPIEDDPDLTDKRFAGNPTRSYRSRAPLRVLHEVHGWEGPSAAALEAMRAGLARHRADQNARLAAIPEADALAQARAEAEAAARAWAADAAAESTVLIMHLQGLAVSTRLRLTARSASRGETQTFEAPAPPPNQPSPIQADPLPDPALRRHPGWREAWAAVLECCLTELGLSLEAHLHITLDAPDGALRFALNARGAERAWQRSIRLKGGQLVDDAQGELWDSRAGRFAG